MIPSKLYDRDFMQLNYEEQRILNDYCDRQKALEIERLIPFTDLPEAVRRNMSLFPNNMVLLSDMKRAADLSAQNEEFSEIIRDAEKTERHILNYINHHRAYHIVCGILHQRFQFGHHDCYLFKELWLDNKYRCDYVIVGKGSGGYEFLLIEFEKAQGRITLKNGYPGESLRKGENQVRDWRNWMDANHAVFFADLRLVSSRTNMPNEFYKYDRTRFHYAVVCGLRDDFDETTYREKRRKMQEDNIHILHYNTLLENAKALLNMNSF